MAKCYICGRNAGFFKNVHEECEKKRKQDQHYMCMIVKESILTGKKVEDLEKRLESIAKRTGMESSSVREYVITGVERAIEDFLDDGLLDNEEESKLRKFVDIFNLKTEEIDQNGAWKKVKMALILRKVSEGGNIDEIGTMGLKTHLFNFLNDENLVWMFENVPYYEGRSKRPTIKVDHIMQVGLNKSLYYKNKALKGKLIDTREMIHHDVGILAITTKRLYFYGKSISFRIPYENVVSFSPFENGLGLNRDLENAKPQFFLTNEGWFTFNLVKMLIEKNS